jgi:hypothetical protein
VNEGSCRIERTSMIFAAFDDTERAPRSVRTRPDAGCRGASAPNATLFVVVVAPADGTRAATARGDFGKSAFFCSSRTSRCLLVPDDMGCRAQSAMGLVEK